MRGSKLLFVASHRDEFPGKGRGLFKANVRHSQLPPRYYCLHNPRRVDNQRIGQVVREIFEPQSQEPINPFVRLLVSDIECSQRTG